MVTSQIAVMTGIGWVRVSIIVDPVCRFVLMDRLRITGTSGPPYRRSLMRRVRFRYLEGGRGCRQLSGTQPRAGLRRGNRASSSYFYTHGYSS
jgi:hypothetical protein